MGVLGGVGGWREERVQGAGDGWRCLRELGGALRPVAGCSTVDAYRPTADATRLGVENSSVSSKGFRLNTASVMEARVESTGSSGSRIRGTCGMSDSPGGGAARGMCSGPRQDVVARGEEPRRSRW